MEVSWETWELVRWQRRQDARERKAEGSEQGPTSSGEKAAEKLARHLNIAGMEVWADTEGGDAACGGGTACGELGAGDRYGVGTSMRRAYPVFRERRRGKCGRAALRWLRARGCRRDERNRQWDEQKCSTTRREDAKAAWGACGGDVVAGAAAVGKQHAAAAVT
jgi:hypothetical protein